MGAPAPSRAFSLAHSLRSASEGEDIFIGGTEKSPAPSKRLATRATRLKTAGIQTYLLTWVPTGHARALPLGAVEADNSWYPNLSTRGVRPGTHSSSHFGASEAASPGFWTVLSALFPTTSQPSRGRTLQHCK